MKWSKNSTVCVLLLLLLPFAVAALTVVECVDDQGNSSFRDKCPPGMTVKSTKELRGERKAEVSSLEEIAAANPVVLFSASNCDACDLVRNQLETRKVPFTEKDSSSDPDNQAELAAVTGGALTVPTVTVGTQKFTGYAKVELDSALNEAGYP